MRVLIFSADIGEGHDAPARELRDGVLARHPEAQVVIVDTLAAAGALVHGAVRSSSELVLERVPALYDLQYWLIASFGPTRQLGRRLAFAFACRGLARAVAEQRPDIVVCTYPLATEVLGELRSRGRLGVPLVSAVTDLAGLGYWAHRGCDVHLVIHAESAAEVRAVAGSGARVAHVRGLSSPAFERPVDMASARDRLGLEIDAPLVAVSGGGWGVGDLEGAVAAALASGPRTQALALCGRNEALRARLARTFAHQPQVTAIGFSDRMGDVLGAADVLVHSTAGLTVLEALVRGTRVISYGWGFGHVRRNNEAYRRFGLADVVTDRAELAGAIQRALATPRRPDLGYATLPAAADVVLGLATMSASR